MEKTTNPISHISNKSLSIQVSLNGFCFSVYNKENESIELQKDISINETESLLDQLAYIFNEYSTIFYSFICSPLA